MKELFEKFKLNDDLLKNVNGGYTGGVCVSVTTIQNLGFDPSMLAGFGFVINGDNAVLSMDIIMGLLSQDAEGFVGLLGGLVSFFPDVPSQFIALCGTNNIQISSLPTVAQTFLASYM